MFNLVAIDAKIAKFLFPGMQLLEFREVPMHYSCSACWTFSGSDFLGSFLAVSYRAQVLQDILHHGFPMWGRRGRTKLAIPSCARSSITQTVLHELHVSGLEKCGAPWDLSSLGLPRNSTRVPGAKLKQVLKTKILCIY